MFRICRHLSAVVQWLGSSHSGAALTLDLPLLGCSGCPVQAGYAGVSGRWWLPSGAGGCHCCRHGCRRAVTVFPGKVRHRSGGRRRTGLLPTRRGARQTRTILPTAVYQGPGRVLYWVDGAAEGAAMTVKRSAPKRRILTRCDRPVSAWVPWVGIWQVSNQDWRTMRASTCHAMVRDFAVPEGSGGACTGERNRGPLGNQGANLASVPGVFASSITRYGRCPSAAVLARLPMPCRHCWRTDQPDRLGTL